MITLNVVQITMTHSLHNYLGKAIATLSPSANRMQLLTKRFPAVLTFEWTAIALQQN